MTDGDGVAKVWDLDRRKDLGWRFGSPVLRCFVLPLFTIKIPVDGVCLR